MVITCDKKTGFAVGDNRLVKIYNAKTGELFYEKLAKKLPFAFNLPKGQYKTLNNVVKQSQPRKYRLPQMPRRERNEEMPDNVRMVFMDNPNKASIFRSQRLIVMDNAFKELSYTQRLAAFLHECAHYYYSTEEYCDLWAFRKMLLMGFNPSQVWDALHNTLSNAPGMMKRKDFLLTACEKSFE